MAATRLSCLCRGRTTESSTHLFAARPRLLPAIRSAPGFLSSRVRGRLHGSRRAGRSPTKQPLEVMQPAEGALDKHTGAPRSEPCSVWRRAISGAVSDHASTPRTRNRRHRVFAMPVELATATVSDLPQAACRKPTGLRSPWNVDSGSASAPTVAEAGMADEPAVVAGAGITEECVDAVTQACAMLIRHEAAEIVEAAGMRETLTSRQGCHA
jgi:hypothetical protein